MKAREVMSSPAITVSAATPIWIGAEIMQRTGHGFLPVVDQGRVVGTLTARDLTLRMALCMPTFDGDPVSLIMSTPVAAFDADDEVEDLVNFMRQNDLPRIPIIDQVMKPVGVVSMEDLAGIASDESIATNLIRHTENGMTPRRENACCVPGHYLG